MYKKKMYTQILNDILSDLNGYYVDSMEAKFHSKVFCFIFKCEQHNFKFL